jgi:hypothetical protein
MTISHQDAITIEQLYPTEDHQDILFSDIFYLKGSTVKDPYLITVLGKTKPITITNLKTKTSANIIKAIQHRINIYKTYGWKITKVITDHESNFSASIKQLQTLGVELIQNSPESHSRTAERAIRTIKGMARATYLSLPYTLPPQLYHHLLQYVTERYNIHPQVDGDSQSPREKITDTKVTYNIDIKVAFGTIGIFPVPKAYQNTDLSERGELGIVIGNAYTKHGVCTIYIPSRKSICYRTKFTVVTCDEAIAKAISLALRDDDFLSDTASPLTAQSM